MLTLDEIRNKTPEEIYSVITTQFVEKQDHKEILLVKNNLITEKNNIINQRDHQIDHLRWRINKLLHEQYGKSSEKQVSVDQARLFDEAAEKESEVIETTEALAETNNLITVPEHQRNKRGRPALPTDLPRITKTYDLTEDEKQCTCGCELVKIGEKKKEQLEFIPAQVRVIEHIRYQYACRGCEDVMKLASMPRQPIPKSIASPGLLSHILVSKFEDHLPFYRQENILSRMGIELGRGSFCTWTQQCAELFTPLIKVMRSIMTAYDLGYSDETRLQVLKEPDRTAESKSYMWLFIGGKEKERCYIYQYNSSRGHEIPKEFWLGFKGYLHTDGFSGYQTLFKNETISIQGIHCWAHARRKFIEAAKQSKKATLANWAVKQIAELYKLEKHFKSQFYTVQQIHEQRQKKSKPILTKIKKWLNEHVNQVPPKHPIGVAINYTLKFWDNLIRYIDDGRFEIDNNRTERGIKPFVIGRKNWLFHDSVNGAEAGAIIYSLIETCKAHNVNAYLYLKYVLHELPNCDKSEKAYQSLLPFNVDHDKLWEFNR